MWKGANGKFDVWFKEEYVGSFSSIAFGGSRAGGTRWHWSGTTAKRWAKGTRLWDVSPEDILSFERRDPRWKNLTGVW